MELENPPSLPDAHQQIRLGDIQSSVRKWSTAIEYYLRAIEYFKAIQNTLQDNSLISIIQAQIIQCEKTINLCRLKDRSEQAANSTSNLKTPTKPYRMVRRHCIPPLENTDMLGGHSGTDSFAAFIFPKAPQANSAQAAIAVKKKKKPDSHKIEELQMGYAALQTHLKAAFDDIERLKHENNELRTQREPNISPQQQIDSGSLINSHPEENEEDDSETELEVTI